MKVGSLVECVKLPHVSEFAKKYVNWLPEVGITYTIRQILTDKNPPESTVVYLDEGIMGHFQGLELGANIDYFREIQPPQDLTEILEYQHPKYLLIT